MNHAKKSVEIQLISDSEQSVSKTLPQKVPMNHAKKSVGLSLLTVYNASNSKAGKCTECNLSFELMTDLKNHFAKVHGKSGVRKPDVQQLTGNENEKFKSSVQVNLCQKILFLHQLTHNMTTDCSWIYQFSI